MTNNKKVLSTFEREMKNSKFKKAFEKSYKEFLLSELLIAMMEEDEVSVRELLKKQIYLPLLFKRLGQANKMI